MIGETYRPFGLMFGSVCGALIAAGGTVVLAVDAVQAASASQAALSVFVFLTAVVAARAACTSLKVGEDGIQLVNPFSRHRIDWHEVEEFAVHRFGIGDERAAVIRSDGSVIQIWAIEGMAGTRGQQSPVEEIVDGLNELITPGTSGLN